MVERILPVTTCYISTSDPKKGYAFVKRSFDIVLSALMLVVLFPVFLVLAVVCAIDTKGTPLFFQTRMGRHNQPFKMLKFRTMDSKAPANVATHQLRDADRYISPIGAMLRKMSVDELPQLVNILKGDMSFVGPRPVILAEKDLLSLRVRNGACSVRPGLTGWSQVNGRDNLPIPEKAEMDGFYAKNIGVKMDMAVLVKTVSCVLRGSDVQEGENPTVSGKTTGKQERSA